MRSAFRTAHGKSAVFSGVFGGPETPCFLVEGANPSENAVFSRANSALVFGPLLAGGVLRGWGKYNVFAVGGAWGNPCVKIRRFLIEKRVSILTSYRNDSFVKLIARLH